MMESRSRLFVYAVGRTTVSKQTLMNLARLRKHFIDLWLWSSNAFSTSFPLFKHFSAGDPYPNYLRVQIRTWLLSRFRCNPSASRSYTWDISFKSQSMVTDLNSSHRSALGHMTYRTYELHVRFSYLEQRILNPTDPEEEDLCRAADGIFPLPSTARAAENYQ